MNILVIGGGGTIGRVVVEYFQQKHKVFIAGRNHGDVSVDIADESSIKEMFQQLNDLDAVLCIAGEAKWDYLSEMTEEDEQKSSELRQDVELFILEPYIVDLRSDPWFSLWMRRIKNLNELVLIKELVFHDSYTGSTQEYHWRRNQEEHVEKDEFLSEVRSEEISSNENYR